MVTHGFVELRGLSSNFTGRIVISNATSQAYMDGRGSGAAAMFHFGTTNEGTHVYRAGFVRIMRDASSSTNAEPFHLYGWNGEGVVRFFNTTNCRYMGVIRLYTNGVVRHSHWFPSNVSSNGSRRDFWFEGLVEDDGGGRTLHVLHQLGNDTTGRQTRLSRFVLDGANGRGRLRHTGPTHVTVNWAPMGTEEFACWLQVQSGVDLLRPEGWLWLGGSVTNADGRWVGSAGGNGILVLAAADQTLAGLRAFGTGTMNKVISDPAFVETNRLTLNIAGGVTNYCNVWLGEPGAPTGRMVKVVKAGGGVLALTRPVTVDDWLEVRTGTVWVATTVATSQQGGVWVGATGVLGGDGVVSSRVVTAAGATVSPGTGGIGRLTFPGGWAASNGARFRVDVAGATSDVVRIHNGWTAPNAATVEVAVAGPPSSAPPWTIIETIDGTIGGSPANWSVSPGFAVRGVGDRVELGAAPVITSAPTNTAPAEGEARFSVSAQGTVPLFYQWRTNGIAVAGATNSTLTLTNLAPAAADLPVDVIVSNWTGTAVTGAVVSGTGFAPQWTVQPNDQHVYVGGPVQFTAMATGSPPVWLFWQRNAVTIAGATNPSLEWLALNVADSGTVVRAIATNAVGSTTSRAALLHVWASPFWLPGSGITPQPGTGAFRLQFAAIPGTPHTIEVNEHLTNAAGWQALTTVVASAEGTVVLSLPAPSTNRFYRIRSGGP